MLVEKGCSSDDTDNLPSVRPTGFLKSTPELLGVVQDGGRHPESKGSTVCFSYLESKRERLRDSVVCSGRLWGKGNNVSLFVYDGDKDSVYRGLTHMSPHWLVGSNGP